MPGHCARLEHERLGALAGRNVFIKTSDESVPVPWSQRNHELKVDGDASAPEESISGHTWPSRRGSEDLRAAPTGQSTETVDVEPDL